MRLQCLKLHSVFFQMTLLLHMAR